MIPTTTETEVLQQDFTLTSERDLPTKTYRMVYDRKINDEYRVSGKTDNLLAMRQAIFKIVNTERRMYNRVYSNNYGIELVDLYGMPMEYVIPEAQRRITEALTWDERITSVENFGFSNQKGKLTVTFTAKTIFGDVDSSVQVSF